MVLVFALMLALATDAQDTPGRPIGGVAMPQMPGGNNGAPPTPGTATLRGRVFAADTGQPLRKAQVRIFDGEIRENRMASTDAEGRYEFKEVRAGRYTTNASKGSYVSLGYGQQRPTDLTKPIVILDNQTVEKMDFMLPRGGVITGRILDEFGEPVSDVQVAAQLYQTVQGQRRLVPTGRQVQTNDIGEFRLFGIAPGQYYLVATWRNTNPMNEQDRTAYAPLYYPGTDNIAQAQRLTVSVGQELSDLVMALKPIKATRVTGTARSSEGKPLTGMIMAISTGGFGFNMAGNGQIRTDGTFVVNGLAPGEYTLRAQSFGPAGGDTETATIVITATGEDITDVHLVGSKPSVVTGRVVVDPSVPGPLPTALQLTLTPIDMGAMMGITPSRLSDDGSFELKSPPGKVRLQTFNTPGWSMRAVRLNGVDVIDSGLELRPGENISGVEVEISSRRSVVSGLVTNPRGETIKDYTAIAFSQDREKWKVQNRYQGVGRPDQDGRFTINGLPPGDYYIVALEKMDMSQFGDPDFLDTVRLKATAITIREGETRTVDLKINTAS